MKDPVNIIITSVEFERGGAIFFEGIVDGYPIESSIEGREFELMLRPRFRYLDADNNYIARLDSHNNLHILAELEGFVSYHDIRLTGKIEQSLYEKYIDAK